MYNKQELNILSDKIYNICCKKNIKEFSASVEHDNTINISVRRNDVDILENNNQNSMSICIYLDGQKGIATTCDMSDESLKQTIDKAYNIAKFTQKDKFARLPERQDLAKNFKDLKLYCKEDIDIEKMIDYAKTVEATGIKTKAISQCESSDIYYDKSTGLLFNSLGFRGFRKSAHFGSSATMVADKENDKQRDGEYSIARQFCKLKDPTQVGKIAATKTIARLLPKKIKTGSYPVVFDAPVAKSLFGLFISAVSGANLYTKNSFLLDSMGENVFKKGINIYQKPFIEGLWGSVNFDDDGVSPLETHFIKDGVLKSFVLSSYAARRLNLKSTGNNGGVFNLFIQSQEELSKKQLFAKMNNGLFITETIGMGVNLLTGNYSKGAVGFWVEDGEISHPISQFTIADNLKNIFKNITDIGGDVDTRGNILSGSILISEMKIAGI
jgi:PmbA protein